MNFLRRVSGSVVVSWLSIIIGVGFVFAERGRATEIEVWQFIEKEDLEVVARSGVQEWVRPDVFQALRLSPERLTQQLASVPLETAGCARGQSIVLTLPNPDGEVDRFRLVESPMMEEQLAEWFVHQGYPLKTYSGVSLDCPAKLLRCDWGGPAGFHARVMGPDGVYYIDPYWQGDLRYYASYYAPANRKPTDHICAVEDHYAPENDATAPTPPNALRTFRLANAATGEYTLFHGGTVVAGQAAVVTAISRVNQVYENELAVRLILVGNNSSVIYTDGATDPYTNNNGSAMLGQNQTNLDSVIRNANYDIGHVFSTGGGGIAGLGVVCTASRKAWGVTGSIRPTGDNFWIDFVAHEMGHQFRANHCFDGVGGNCSGGNRNDSTAYEPGSASTIMSYAGLCDADNLQRHSDAYFHRVSLTEILGFVDALSCDGLIATTNSYAPTVDAGPNYTIPAGTPFELTAGSSGDLDGDALTFCWEQFDLSAGVSGDPLSAGDQGDNPILRSWSPVASPTRVFPLLTDLINNTTSKGEVLPNTNRTLKFRLTVRDNHVLGGLTAFDDMQVTVTTTAGPFTLSSPNGGETVNGTTTVMWDSAGTAFPPVNALYVDLLLSTDGGYTFPYPLALGTANDGTELVTLPAVSTAAARIKVQGAATIFFDISDADFQIGDEPGTNTPVPTPTGTGPTPTPTSSPVAGQWPMFRFNATRSGSCSYGGPEQLGLRWYFLAGGSVESSPAIGNDGVIYVGSTDSRLYAINPDGSLAWSYTTGGSVVSSPAVGAIGTIYVGSTDGFLYALTPQGSLLWRYETGAGITSSPALGADGAVYVGSADGYLYAIEPSGTLRWRYQTGGPIDSSPALDATGAVYVGSADSYLYTLTPGGALAWRYLVGAAIHSSPALDANGTVYFGSDDHYLYALSSTGGLLWRYQTGGAIAASPAVSNQGTIYIGSDDKYFYALTPEGELLWRRSTVERTESSPIIDAGGSVFFGSDSGYVYAVDSEGATLWTQYLGSAVATSPALATDGTLYVGAGLLFAFHADSSTVLPNLIMNQHVFQAGDQFRVDLNLLNYGPAGTVNLAIALGVPVGSDYFYYFWPTWSTALAWEQRILTTGQNTWENVLKFTWPEGAGSHTGLQFIAAYLDESVTGVIGEIDVEVWGYQ